MLKLIKSSLFHQPFTFIFPCAHIHKMMSSDLLQQIIKGTFKDHFIEWVFYYLVAKEGEA